jgi:N-acyl-D-aspartate/D-glutamate deacylase
VRATALTILGLAIGGAACAVPVEFDLVIRGGTVYEGSGATATGVRQIDAGIRGDRITALGDLTGRRISRVIDATGLAVAPGFIDGDAGSGLVREGYFADLVVFDPALVQPAGPGAVTPYPRGIGYVVVNGVLTVTPEGHTGSRAGRWLAGPGAVDVP